MRHEGPRLNSKADSTPLLPNRRMIEELKLNKELSLIRSPYPRRKLFS